MSFDLTNLGAFIKVQGGYAFKSTDFLSEGERPVLKIKNIRSGYVDYGEVSFVNEYVAQNANKWEAEAGDVLISMTGSGPSAPDSLVGRVAKVWPEDPKALINQRVGRVCLKSEATIDLGFIFYLLSWPETQKYLVVNATGSANQVNISGGLIESIPCPKIDYETSKSISKFLTLLDARARILRETNATLEAIAQALFKSWFVDFDPVRAKAEGRQPQGMDTVTAALFPDSFEESELGMVPKGWTLETLEDAYQINPTRKLIKGSVAPYLDMAGVGTKGHVVTGVIERELGSGTKFINGDTLLARITPCLENGKTAFVDFLDDEHVGWGSTEFVVLRPKPPLPTYHGYLLARHPAFRDHAIQSMSGTSGRQRVQNDVLGRYLIAVPEKEVAGAFAEITENIQVKIAANQVQAQTLTQLRDTLLPRLISGQLRLPEAEAFLEASSYE